MELQAVTQVREYGSPKRELRAGQTLRQRRLTLSLNWDYEHSWLQVLLMVEPKVPLGHRVTQDMVLESAKCPLGQEYTQLPKG